MNRKNWITATAMVALLGLTSSGLAQRTDSPAQDRPGQEREGVRGQQQQQGRPGAARQGATHGGISDQSLAACVAIDNQKEIQLAQLAETKSQSNEVKQFAQMLARDHQKFVQQLEQWTAGQQLLTASADAAQADPLAQRQPANAAPGAAAPAAREPARQIRAQSPDNAGSDQFVQIKREIAQACLKSATREFQSKSGEEFDKCYVGAQVFAHMGMVDALDVLGRHASPQLAQVLQEGKATAQQHLDHAKQLAKQLEGSAASGSRTGQADGQRNNPATTTP